MLTLHNIHTKGRAISDITVNDGKIKNISLPQNDYENSNVHFFFDDALAFPGLTNSHDHLDFNLFPKLRNRIYQNYLEWGEDIHRENKAVINDVIKVPKT